MKKKTVTKILSIMLTGVMALSLTACGKGESKQNLAANAAARENVYKIEEIEFPEKVDGIRSLEVREGKIIATGYAYNDNYATKEMVFRCNIDGSEMETQELSWPEGRQGYLYEMVVDQAGNIYSFRESDPVYDMGENGGISTMPMPRAEADTAEADTAEADTTEADTADEEIDEKELLAEEDPSFGVDMPADGMGEHKTELVCWNSQGAEQWAYAFGADGGDMVYPSGLYLSPKNQLVVRTSESFVIFDMNGQQVKQIPFSTELENINNMKFEEDGTIVALCYTSDWSKQLLKWYNLDTGKVIREEELPASLSNDTLLFGNYYDLYAMNAYSAFTYNVGDEAEKEMMNFVNSDLPADGLYMIADISETQFISVYNDSMEYKPHLAVFTKLDPSEVKEKKVITLGCYYLDYNIKAHVIDFNKNNEEYRIAINDYSRYATPEDWRAGLTKLNTDIVSGNVPDILIVNGNNMSAAMDSYISKGLFADLYQFLDADEELPRDAFLSNVLEALSVNGKLYQLSPQFRIQTVFGKASDLGDRDTWTMDDLKAIVAGKPEGTVAFADETRDSFLGTVLGIVSDQFIDKETGTCSFESDDFKKLLEFAKQFPAELDYGAMDADYDDYYTMRETMYREGRTLFMLAGIYQFRDFNYTEKVTFGEDIKIIGIPNDKGVNGSAIMLDNSMAVSAGSSYKEGAWEFLRYFFTEDYISNKIYGLPITKAGMDKVVEDAQHKPYFMNENGEKEEWDETGWINGVEIPVSPMTKEEAEELRSFIESVTMVGKQNEDIFNIIKEEAAAYYEDQKNVDEVVKIIQSRIQVLVDESR